MLTFLQHASLNESTYGTLEDAKNVIRGLNKAGFQGYLVGGCVRDMLTGHKPKDFDVATDATPDEVLSVFPDGQLVGKKFGVVIVHGIDVATFRKDGTYSDGRRPDSVEFTRHPQDDAARRDFTVNALFMNPFTQEVLDFHGGKLDAKNKVIRAVGNAHDRFTQDHLRMLRADRFAAKLDFDIHPDTFDSMKANAHHITAIDAERQHDELTKSLAIDPARVVKSMDKSGLLSHVFPELGASNTHVIVRTLEGLGKHVGTGLGCAGLFFKMDVPVMEKMCRRLKFHNEEIKHIKGIMELQPRITAVNRSTTMDVLKRLIRDPFFQDALKLYGARVRAADPHAHADAFQHVSTVASNLKLEDLHPEKFVTGDDLIALGMKPGKDFARILVAAENGQLTGHIKSKAQALEMIRAGKL